MNEFYMEDNPFTISPTEDIDLSREVVVNECSSCNYCSKLMDDVYLCKKGVSSVSGKHRNQIELDFGCKKHSNNEHKIEFSIGVENA